MPSFRGVTGQRCAINLAGVDKEIVKRGDWLTSSPELKPVRKIDADLLVLSTEVRPLRHWTPVHVHLGTADVTGRVAILGADQIAPGEPAAAQLVLDQPIGAVARDRFIIRDQSAQRTIGGGHVIDIFPPARGRARPERLNMLAALDTGPMDEQELAWMRRVGDHIYGRDATSGIRDGSR